jgi:type I restriction enzyme S subunit
MSKLLEQINTEKRTMLVLSDYIKIKHGFAFKGEYFSNQPTSNILVTPGNFAIGGGFKADKFKYYKGAIPEDYVLKENDLVVTMTDLSVDADTLGYSALIPNDEKKTFLHNQRVGLVQKKKEGIDFRYLYYLMRTRPYQKYVVSTATGSTVKHTSPDRIASYEYDFPILSTQKKIAEILSAYDAKIENNNLIIKKLEATAQTLFDEWFVNFRFPGYEKVKFIDSEMGEIPEGWEIIPLNKLAHITMGQSPTSNHYNSEKKGLPFHQGVTHFGERYPENVIYSTKGEKIAEENDILISVRAPVGRINIAIEKTILGRGVGLLKSKENKPSFLLYLLKNLFHKEDLFGGGSVFPSITKTELEGLKIISPTRDIVDKFENNISIFDLQIKNLTRENISLKSQRDQLLAKLI